MKENSSVATISPEKPKTVYSWKQYLVILCVVLVMGGCALSLYRMGATHMAEPTMHQYLNRHSKELDKAEFIKLTSINMNTATKEELMAIPSIGEVLAQRILAHRASLGGFSSYDQLLDVKGIGDKTLYKIRVYGYLP